MNDAKQIEQEEPTTLTQAVESLVDEIMNSSGIPIHKSQNIIDIIQRVDKRPKEIEEVHEDRKAMAKTPNLIDLVNMVAREYRSTRMKTLENLSHIEALLK
jgi:endonuclease III